jgi:serine protease Do
MENCSQPSVVSSLISGIIGAIVVVVLLAWWGRVNPTQLSRIFNFNSTQPATQAGPVTANIPQGTTNSPIVEVVKHTNPAVVSIVITQDVPIIERYYEDLPANPFNDFFGDDFRSPFRFRTPQYRQNGTEEREIGGGSGFIVSGDGMIVTNKHVVAQENVEYTVFTNDGTRYTARVIARDPVNDIAVLKIEARDLPYLEFGSSADLQIGQTVIAIGNALGEFRNTVSVGVVSGLSRSVVAGNELGGESEQLENVIQTDAAINPGNSGGPLLDLNGRVVGVNVAIALGSQNVSFALPSDTVKSVVESVQKTGRIVRPFIGVRYTVITPAIKQENNLPYDYGALIVRGEQAADPAVIPGSPADQAGLKEGDIILEADGTRIEANRSLASIINRKQVGDRLRLKVWQNGQERDLEITLHELPQ